MIRALSMAGALVLAVVLLSTAFGPIIGIGVCALAVYLKNPE